LLSAFAARSYALAVNTEGTRVTVLDESIGLALDEGSKTVPLYSRRVLMWFLLQHPPDWTTYRQQYTKQQMALRRAGQRWYQLAPPFTSPYIAAVRPGEQVTLSIADVALMLRASETSIERALQRTDFPLPPAQSPPPRWSREQIDRFLGPPSGSR
jgi:hypothetical protein